MSSSRNLFGVAVVLAFVAGLLQGSRVLLPAYLSSTGSTAADLSAVLMSLTVVLLVVDPIVLFGVGFLWGRRANVPSAFLRLGGWVLVGGLVGSLLGYVTVVLALPDGTTSIIDNSLLVWVIGSLRIGVHAALAVLAGSALAHFRYRYRPTPA